VARCTARFLNVSKSKVIGVRGHGLIRDNNTKTEAGK